MEAMGHLLLDYEEKASCQLGAPSPPVSGTAHSPCHTKPLGLRKSPNEGFPDNTFPHIPRLSRSHSLFKSPCRFDLGSSKGNLENSFVPKMKTRTGDTNRTCHCTASAVSLELVLTVLLFKGLGCVRARFSPAQQKAPAAPGHCLTPQSVLNEPFPIPSQGLFS